MRRIYKNISEEAFCKWIENQGYYPIKRGWPDFFCRNKEGKTIAVEVKPNPWTQLKIEQLIVMSFLKENGIDCFRWDMLNKTLEPIIKESLLKTLPIQGNGSIGDRPKATE